MPIADIFSTRAKREKKGEPEVYQYTDIPNKFRVQAIHIIREGIGDSNYRNYDAGAVYENIHKTLCKEYGVFTLKQYAKSDEEAIFDFMLNTKDHEAVLDIIELALRIIDTYVRKATLYDRSFVRLTADEAINDMNIRLKENAIGYRFESGNIIRIDSEIVHKELIKPTLNLLNEKKYQNANEEYLQVFEHYRHGRNNDCLVSCLKSFESVMKIICSQNNWNYNQNDTAKKLINILIEKELIPPYMENQINALKALLESGIPTLRNKLGGHGQGVNNNNIDDYVANYALNLTASNIKYLIELNKKC